MWLLIIQQSDRPSGSVKSSRGLFFEMSRVLLLVYFLRSLNDVNSSHSIWWSLLTREAALIRRRWCLWVEDGNNTGKTSYFASSTDPNFSLSDLNVGEQWFSVWRSEPFRGHGHEHEGHHGEAGKHQNVVHNIFIGSQVAPLLFCWWKHNFNLNMFLTLSNMIQNI